MSVSESAPRYSIVLSPTKLRKRKMTWGFHGNFELVKIMLEALHSRQDNLVRIALFIQNALKTIGRQTILLAYRRAQRGELGNNVKRRCTLASKMMGILDTEMGTSHVRTELARRLLSVFGSCAMVALRVRICGG
jgi:hypothetical protein